MNGAPQPDWQAIVRTHFAGISAAADESVLDELAQPLADLYDEAVADSKAHAEALVIARSALSEEEKRLAREVEAAQRAQEIGIRMALDADRGAILRMVFAGGARIAAIGLGIGVTGAIALTQVLSGLLFGVSAHDPLRFLVVAGALLAVALAAS